MCAVRGFSASTARLTDAPSSKTCRHTSRFADGCRDPLVVWNGTLLDGHNRYEICTEHGIPFRIKKLKCKSRTEAKIWIHRHQRNRRNLTPTQLAMSVMEDKALVAEIEARVRQEGIESKKGPRRKNESAVARTAREKASSNRTRKELARIAGVSTGLIAKTKAVITHADEPTKAALRAGTTTINRDRYQGRYPPLVVAIDHYPHTAALNRLRTVETLTACADNLIGFTPITRRADDEQRTRRRP